METALSGATCGMDCWYAKQDACRCSCGGRSHGVMALGGDQPRRNCTILGVRYVLGAVNGSWAEINEWAHDLVRREYVNSPLGRAPWARNERNAIWWSKSASDSQMRWPELTGFRMVNHWDRKPSLEWIREDWAETFDSWAALMA